MWSDLSTIGGESDGKVFRVTALIRQNSGE